MVVGVVAMAFQTIWRTNNYYYALAFIVVCTIIAWFAYRYGSFKIVEKLPKAAIYITIGVLMCLMGAFIAVFTIYRHKVYGSMAFDFGIFVQMYHNMAESFAPVTTCERDKLLSHFAVHFSPIYYTLLPFYYIFPTPYTPAHRTGSSGGNRCHSAGWHCRSSSFPTWQRSASLWSICSVWN